MVAVPPSGHGAGYFHRVRRSLADRVDLRAVELPGHGRRHEERRITNAAAAARDTAGLIEGLGAGPIDAVYGESLGAYLALATFPLLGRPRPPLLIVTSNCAPSVRDPIVVAGVESLETAVAAFAAAGAAVPAELVAQLREDPEVAARVVPVWRDDLHLSRSLAAATRELRIDADLVVVAGTDDTGPTWRPTDWSAHTVGRCATMRLAGGHLLSATNPAGVCEVVERALAERRPTALCRRPVRRRRS